MTCAPAFVSSLWEINLAVKILVIDDDTSRKDIAEIISYEGYETREAENGLEGLKVIKEFKPDLIICDIMMPEMDGYQVLEQVRSNPDTNKIPFIIITASRDPQKARQGFNIGADDFLVRPFNVEDLLQAIKARLKRYAEITGTLLVQTNGPIRQIKHHVFLSYARKNITIMQQIKASLNAANLIVWTDENLTPGTEAWTNAIQEAIEFAGCVAVILSPEAKQSVWVNRELSYAKIHQIPVFPVLAAGDERTSLPIEVINAQLVDIQTDYDKNVEKLINAIKAKVVM